MAFSVAVVFGYVSKSSLNVVCGLRFKFFLQSKKGTKRSEPALTCGPRAWLEGVSMATSLQDTFQTMGTYGGFVG